MCALKEGMNDLKKYMSYSDKYYTIMCTNQTIKYGMGGSVGSGTDNMKQYEKSLKMEEGAEISQEAEQDDL